MDNPISYSSIGGVAVNTNIKRLFRTFRAMGAFLQNFLSEDWLSERVQENQSTLLAQLSTKSAEEPLNWLSVISCAITSSVEF